MWPAIRLEPSSGSLKAAVAVRRIGFDDGDDLLDGNVEVGAADALSGADERNGLDGWEERSSP